jgi:membrane fusion protein, multidrug efflux system
MNKKTILLGVGGIALVALGWQAWSWFSHGRYRLQTDNAYVRADISLVAAKTEGYVRSIGAEDNQPVLAGSALVTLDPRDSAVSVATAEADLLRAQADAARARSDVRRIESEAVRMQAEASAAKSGALQSASLAQQARLDANSRSLSVDVTGQQIAVQADSVVQSEAALQAAQAASAALQADQRRYQALAARGYVSRAKLDQIEAQAVVSQANVAQARAALAVARQQIGVLSANRAKTSSEATSAGAGASGAMIGAQGASARAQAAQAAAVSGRTAIGAALASVQAADANVQAAQARLDGARLGEDYATIAAPISGLVANRTVQIGQLVRPGSVLMAIVPLDQVFVVANFKETQIGKLRQGQRVTMKVDAFPDLDVTGQIDSVAPASGSQFSLLPTDTATGNFTKIVQRVPVRIAIDPQWRDKGVLRPGLSVTATVDTRTPQTARTIASMAPVRK